MFFNIFSLFFTGVLFWQGLWKSIGLFKKIFEYENIPLKIIEYGDPDGTGRDLSAYNEILLRAEAYIGWGILLPENFARVVETSV